MVSGQQERWRFVYQFHFDTVFFSDQLSVFVDLFTSVFCCLFILAKGNLSIEKMEELLHPL